MTMTAHRNAERTRQMAKQRVWATPEAVDAIVQLRNQVGSNLLLRHIAGVEGAPEVRLASTSFPRGGDDVCLGTVGGVPFLIDRGHDISLGYPDFHIDVTPTQLDNDETGVRTQYHLISRAVRR
jgi:uncharacterized protein (DUF779 family)